MLSPSRAVTNRPSNYCGITRQKSLAAAGVAGMNKCLRFLTSSLRRRNLQRLSLSISFCSVSRRPNVTHRYIMTLNRSHREGKEKAHCHIRVSPSFSAFGLLSFSFSRVLLRHPFDSCKRNQFYGEVRSGEDGPARRNPDG